MKRKEYKCPILSVNYILEDVLSASNKTFVEDMTEDIFG